MTDFFEIDDLTLWLGVLERVVDSSTNMVVITDADRRIKWVNATYTRITGWTLSECIGKTPKEMLHGPETSQEVVGQIATRLRAGEPVKHVELVNYRKNGEAYRVSLDIEAVRDTSGTVFAYLSVQTDITDQHQLELHSAELKRRLEMAQRLARLGRIETDALTGHAQWSSEVFRIFGEAPSNEPRGLFDLLARAIDTDLELLNHKFRACCEAGQEIDFELKVEGRRGVRWLRCRGLPVAAAASHVLPASWSVQDITRYKTSLEDKRLLNEKLNRLVQQRTRRLEESNQALEDFSYALSHDLRTPLRHVAGYAEAMAEPLRSGETEECLRYCHKIVHAARKMQELIDGMLAFARAGKTALRMEPIPLTTMVSEVKLAIEPTASAHVVQWDIAADLPIIYGDPVLIREVWVNLLENAVKYSSKRERSHVRVDWTPQEEGWEFVVQDNGAGFDPQRAQKLFTMFHRLHREDQFAGTGVGLALVRRIVESHGGRISAESLPDEGAVFRFFLPDLPSTLGPTGRRDQRSPNLAD